jgi:hypothetical protein
VMTRPPYNDARRVFWIVDNCSAHLAPKPLSVCAFAILGWCSCTPQFMPAGSTRSKSISRLSRERS